MEIIILAYSITSYGNRAVPLLTKISEVTGLTINNIILPVDNINNQFNTNPFNLMWFLIGFLIEDGHIGTHIRDTKIGLVFIPMFRITQINTVLNMSLY